MKQYLVDRGLTHTRGKPYHPMTQGKIERYHRSLKNVLLLDNYYCPEDLKSQIAEFVTYHESLNNLTPADAYHGRGAKILEQREKTKRRTIEGRRTEYRKALAVGKCVS